MENRFNHSSTHFFLLTNNHLQLILLYEKFYSIEGRGRMYSSIWSISGKSHAGHQSFLIYGSTSKSNITSIGVLKQIIHLNILNWMFLCLYLVGLQWKCSWWNIPFSNYNSRFFVELFGLIVQELSLLHNLGNSTYHNIEALFLPTLKKKNKTFQRQCTVNVQIVLSTANNFLIKVYFIKKFSRAF